MEVSCSGKVDALLLCCLQTLFFLPKDEVLSVGHLLFVVFIGSDMVVSMNCR